MPNFRRARAFPLRAELRPVPDVRGRLLPRPRREPRLRSRPPRAGARRIGILLSLRRISLHPLCQPRRLGHRFLHHLSTPRPGHGHGGLSGRTGWKMEILQCLLNTCNDGRRKNLFSLAAFLPPLNDLRRTQTALIQMDAALPQRAQKAAQMLHESARIRGVALRLRKKPVDASP